MKRVLCGSNAVRYLRCSMILTVLRAAEGRGTALSSTPTWTPQARERDSQEGERHSALAGSIPSRWHEKRKRTLSLTHSFVRAAATPLFSSLHLLSAVNSSLDCAPLQRAAPYLSPSRIAVHPPLRLELLLTSAPPLSLSVCAIALCVVVIIVAPLRRRKKRSTPQSAPQLLPRLHFRAAAFQCSRRHTRLIAPCEPFFSLWRFSCPWPRRRHRR